MRNKIMEAVESSQLRQDFPDFSVGDNIKVHVRIKEGEKERIQVYEGLVIAIKHAGTNKTFNVRKLSYGIGVERTFLFSSPLISHIDVVRKNKVRRSKLYFIRERTGKAARLKEIKTTNKK